MENYLSPGDPLFQFLEALGAMVIVAVIIIGSVISYDWWQEKQEKEREEKNG